MSISFSPDSKTIVAASSEGRAYLWPIESVDELLARGCNWLEGYLITNPLTLTKLTSCQTPERKQASLSYLLDESETLASKGRMVEAIAGFTTVKQWNPSWPEDPKAYAEKMADQNQQSNK